MLDTVLNTLYLMLFTPYISPRGDDFFPLFTHKEIGIDIEEVSKVPR